MIDLKVIGLTGGIGSGKTTVATIFELLGVPVYNSDFRAKILMEQNPEIKKSLTNHFGADVYKTDGRLNRTYLSEILFNNKEELNWVNSIVHPIVAIDFNSWKSSQVHPFVIKESALLIETLGRQSVDKIIVVIASKDLRISRVKSRDQLTEAGILKRMENQLDDDHLKKQSDFIILNQGAQSVIRQTLKIYKALTLLYKNSY